MRLTVESTKMISTNEEKGSKMVSEREETLKDDGKASMSHEQYHPQSGSS